MTAYSRQIWANGRGRGQWAPGATELSADRLNHMEAGIESSIQQATGSETGVWVNDSSVDPAITIGNAPDSAGFAGTGTPNLALGALAIYQKFGDEAGGTGASITHTTQAAYALANYYGPTTDDSMECLSAFVAAKDVTTNYTQSKPITALEGIAQVEAGNTADSNAPARAVAARINAAGTGSSIHTAEAFYMSVNSSGGPPYGTITNFYGVHQPLASGATNAYGVYVADKINSEDALTLGKSGWSGSMSAKLAGNSDGAVSFLLINLPTSTDVAGTLTGIRINGGTGQTKRLQEWWGPGGAQAATYVDNGGALNTRATLTVRDSSLNPLVSLTTGGPKWDAASLQQTTVGAAGAASALPATPTKYLKVVDSAGTTLVIPAYAA